VVQEPQALTSAKGTDNIFDLSERKLCRPLALVHGIFIGSPQKLIQISKLVFDTLLRVDVHKPAQALKSVKCPGNTFDLNPK
jgi:hypothetical protein